MGLKQLLTLVIWTLCLYASLVFANKHENALPDTITWGGGGAFTSTVKHGGEVYLSSDVTGVWKLSPNEMWEPFVNGLTNYNVTALVSFNHRLYAITTQNISVLDDDSQWSTLDVAINTYRSKTKQAFAINVEQSLLCIAEDGISCITQTNSVFNFAHKNIHFNGVAFHKNQNNILYAFSNKSVFEIDIVARQVTNEYKYDADVIAIGITKQNTFIATTKNIFRYGDKTRPLFTTQKHQIHNFTVFNGKDFYVSIGKNKWNTRFYSISYQNDRFEKEFRFSFNFDDSLPHRDRQKHTTSFLSINEFNNTLWLTDYWGVYKLVKQNTQHFIEYSQNAHNTVAMDLLVTADAFYVASMDVGLTALKRNNPHLTKNLTPYNLTGHAWSVKAFNDKVYALVSPWNSANDSLVEYDEKAHSSKVTILGNYKVRKSDKALWGNAYSRSLVSFGGIKTARDGINGGIIDIADNHQNTHRSPTVQVGESNRILYSMSPYKEFLYASSCEAPFELNQYDAALELVKIFALPSNFCVFKLYGSGDSLYLLGNQNNRATAYRFDGHHFQKVLQTNAGSAFLAMATTKDNQALTLLATTNWSNLANSKLFASKDLSSGFTDISHLISHKNGISDIEYDELSDSFVVLMKVGGIRFLSTALISKHL